MFSAQLRDYAEYLPSKILPLGADFEDVLRRPEEASLAGADQLELSKPNEPAAYSLKQLERC